MHAPQPETNSRFETRPVNSQDLGHPARVTSRPHIALDLEMVPRRDICGLMFPLSFAFHERAPAVKEESSRVTVSGHHEVKCMSDIYLLDAGQILAFNS